MGRGLSVLAVAALAFGLGAFTSDKLTIGAPIQTEIFQRPGLKFSVPYVTPAAPNSVIAFDVAPSGRPDPYGNHGFAWIDVLNHGEPDGNPLATARMGINKSAVWFGSMSFEGHAPVPVEFVVGSKVIARFTPSGGLEFVQGGEVVGKIDVGSSGLTLSGFRDLEDLKARVTAIEKAAAK